MSMHLLLKIALAGVIVAFAALFAINTFIPPPAEEYVRAREYFTEAEIEAGLQYSFERRLLFWAGTALELAVLIGLVATGAARRLCDRFSRWVGYLADNDRGVVGMGSDEGRWQSHAIT